MKERGWWMKRKIFGRMNKEWMNGWMNDWMNGWTNE